MSLLGEDVPIGLTEKVTRPEVETPDRSNGRFYPIGKTYQYAPTGLLTLSIKNLYLDKTRINWSDTARALLEAQGGHFLLGTVGAAAWLIRCLSRRLRLSDQL